VSRPSTRERGFALAAARALQADAARFCRQRAPATAGDAEALARHAAGLVDEAARAREAQALGRAVPAGLERIDRSWYLPPPRSSSPAAEAHLLRAAFAQLVAMEDDDAGDDAHRRDDDEGAHHRDDGDARDDRETPLDRCAPDAIERALVALGRRRVALAFVGAPRGGLAQLCARIGEPAASELVAEVHALKAAAPSPAEVKAAQRALFHGDDGELRPGGGGLDAAHALFFRIGAAWIAPALASDGDQLRRAAQRLPRALGQTLLDEALAPASAEEGAAARGQLANALARAL
jgi:hypothetical protein